MFTLTKEDKPVFALLLPALIIILLLAFVSTGQAQTQIVGSNDESNNDALILDLVKSKLRQVQLINEANKFSVEEVQPAKDKAIAANADFEQKQEMMQKAGEELKKMQEEYSFAKKTLEEKTGCIINEETMVLDCTKEDK